MYKSWKKDKFRRNGKGRRWSIGWIHPFFKSSWCNSYILQIVLVQNRLRGKELDKFCPPSSSDDLCLSSVFILLQCKVTSRQARHSKMYIVQFKKKSIYSFCFIFVFDLHHQLGKISVTKWKILKVERLAKILKYWDEKNDLWKKV